MERRIWLAAAASLSVGFLAWHKRAPAPSAAQQAQPVLIRADASKHTPISSLIYGINFAELGGRNPATLWGTALPRYSLNRFGGNRISSFNWETGFSNCGVDCTDFPNDTNLLDNVSAKAGVGSALRPRIDATFAAGASIVVSVPILGFAARDASGPQPVPVATAPARPGTPSPAHWVQTVARDPAGPTATPDVTDGFIYTDDEALWLTTRYPGAKADARRTIQFELDNEPDLWSGTHPEIRGRLPGGPNRGQIATGYDELVEKTLAHAKAIKSVWPAAVVWGGGFGGFDGLVQLNFDAHPEGPPAGRTYYLDEFLEKMKAAEKDPAFGGRMLDVLDFHWYAQQQGVSNDDEPQTPAVIAAREQAPRSLWDPLYVENSWVAAAVPRGDRENCHGVIRGRCPLRLVPRVLERIAKSYPGTKLALGEYWYGRGGDISAAVTNADVLGILGRSGVYAAALWPNASNIWAYNRANHCNDDGTCAATHAYQCALRAIDLYRNYDGAGGQFGDLSIETTVIDPAFTAPASQDERVTAYASRDSSGGDRMTVVAINKSLDASIRIGLQPEHTGALRRAEVWRVTGSNGGAGGCTLPVRQADLPASPPGSEPKPNAFTDALPPQSITIFVLKP